MGHVFFTSGGSESADSAIRLAHAYHLACGRPERWKVIGRHPSYHGLTFGALAAGSHHNRRKGFEPLLLDFPHVPWDDAAALEATIEREGADTIAGFLFEPITGAAGGCLIPTDDYWRAVTDICRRHGILMIADEVMTGFGRTGTRWGFQHFPLQPDILYGGKGLGGGYVPMGMVAATDEIVDALRGSGFMFFTFTGADAMCAGAAAVLDVIEREHLVERSAAIGDVLAERFDDALARPSGRGRHPRSWRCSAASSCGPAAARSPPASCASAWRATCGSTRPGPACPPVTDAVMIGAPLTISEPEVDRARRSPRRRHRRRRRPRLTAPVADGTVAAMLQIILPLGLIVGVLVGWMIGRARGMPLLGALLGIFSLSDGSPSP